MIEILEFKNDGAEPLVRLGCSCGDPCLASYHCEGDQIIYCTHCGEITSRDRLRNEVTMANQSSEWKWENVVNRDECPMVNVSIPVKVFLEEEGAPAAEGHAGCVTKISTDRCFMRLDAPAPGLHETIANRRPLRLDLLSEFPPLAELTACELEEAVHPHGDAGPIYYKLKLAPRSKRQMAELTDFYQTACGLRFDWQVLVYSDEEHSSSLRRMLVDCLPMARIEITTHGGEFVRLFREKRYNLFILPPLPDYMKMIKAERPSDGGQPPLILALVRQRTAAEIGNALHWGARDILHYDCDMGELRHALQRCLEHSGPDASRPLPSLGRKLSGRAAAHERPANVSVGDEETIQLLLEASETHDPHISNHLKRIASYCGAITKCLGWEGERIAQLATASKLHDVGKIGVPDEILRKTGALTQDERKIMQQHTRFGHHILQAGSSGLLRMASMIALRHHERYDGRGYPDGLAGDAIPLEAQIVSVADVFDALTTARPYKPAWPNDKAVDFLRENKGHMFAPNVVQAFMEGLPEIRKSQLAFLDDFRDIWTERRRHARHPMAPVTIDLEIAMPEETFRPFRLVGHLTNISEGGVKAKITNVTGDLFSTLVSTRRYGKLHCEDPDWKELDNLPCEVVWIDYYAVPDPNACIMGINFHRERPNLLDTLQKLAMTVIDQALSREHPAPAGM